MTRLLLLVLLAGCGDDPPARPAAAPAPPPRALEGRGVARDLLREWTAADLFEGEHLVIDFGTARDAIYTLGGAETGWGPALDDGVSYRVAFGRTSQLLLPAEPADLVLALELRSEGARTVGVSWNGRMLEWLELGREERFRSHSVRIPRDAVVAGTNRVAFVSLSTADSPHGVPTTFSLAKLTLGPAGEIAAAVTEEAGALVVRGPARLAYWVSPPERGALSLAASCDEGTARVRVRATNDAAATELVDAVIEARASRHEAEIAAGDPIRLELAVSDLAGGCDLRISELALHGARREPIALSASKIVLLVADTFRADRALAATLPHPGLDRLTAQGATFSFAHSTTNWTLPAVVSLLTSLHPPAHGVSTPRDAVHDDELILPEILNEAGFATALFAANGYVSEGFGLRQGWDEYRNYVEEQEQASYREARADRVFADGLRFIREHRDERFFVYLHTFDPHAPYDAPPEFLARIDPEPMDEGALVALSAGGREVSAATLGDLQRNRLRPTAREEARIRALYDAEIAYHDAELASFLEALEADGLLRDTLVIFASDHGEELADHGSYGHMHSPYEELVHVPLVLRHASIDSHRSRDAVSLVDVAPTILHAAGIDAPPGFQGRSLLDSGASSAAAASFVDGSHALVTRDAKLLVHPDAIFANDYWLDLRDAERTPQSIAARPIATRFAYVELGRIFGRGRALPPADGPAEAEVPAIVADQLRAIGYGR